MEPSILVASTFIQPWWTCTRDRWAGAIARNRRARCGLSSLADALSAHNITTRTGLGLFWCKWARQQPQQPQRAAGHHRRRCQLAPFLVLACQFLTNHGLQASRGARLGFLLSRYVAPARRVPVHVSRVRACFCYAGPFSGVLFICLNVDYRILFTPLTESVVRDGLEFYTTFYNSPPAIKASTGMASIFVFLLTYAPCERTSRGLQALLHSVMGVGLLGLVGKLHKWDDSAMFFDGSSLALSAFSSVGLPASSDVRSLRAPSIQSYTLAHTFRGPGAYIFALAIYLTVGIPACRTVVDPVPDVDTHADQVEALRVLSAGNTIIIVLLGGILVLQAGEQWARRLEEKMLREAGEQEAQKPATTVDASKESKKDK
ncbi:LOW QUALITY PROTEIN: hypothetical protein ACG7TL_005774 [Trametes sanguinea]